MAAASDAAALSLEMALKVATSIRGQLSAMRDQALASQRAGSLPQACASYPLIKLQLPDGSAAPGGQPLLLPVRLLPSEAQDAGAGVLHTAALLARGCYEELPATRGTHGSSPSKPPLPREHPAPLVAGSGEQGVPPKSVDEGPRSARASGGGWSLPSAALAGQAAADWALPSVRRLALGGGGPGLVSDSSTFGGAEEGQDSIEAVVAALRAESIGSEPLAPAPESAAIHTLAGGACLASPGGGALRGRAAGLCEAAPAAGARLAALRAGRRAGGGGGAAVTPDKMQQLRRQFCEVEQQAAEHKRLLMAKMREVNAVASRNQQRRGPGRGMPGHAPFLPASPMAASAPARAPGGAPPQKSGGSLRCPGGQENAGPGPQLPADLQQALGDSRGSSPARVPLVRPSRRTSISLQALLSAHESPGGAGGPAGRQGTAPPGGRSGVADVTGVARAAPLWAPASEARQPAAGPSDGASPPVDGGLDAWMTEARQWDALLGGGGGSQARTPDGAVRPSSRGSSPSGSQPGTLRSLLGMLSPCRKLQSPPVTPGLGADACPESPLAAGLQRMASLSFGQPDPQPLQLVRSEDAAAPPPALQRRPPRAAAAALAPATELLALPAGRKRCEPDEGHGAPPPAAKKVSPEPSSRQFSRSLMLLEAAVKHAAPEPTTRDAGSMNVVTLQRSPRATLRPPARPALPLGKPPLPGKGRSAAPAGAPLPTKGGPTAPAAVAPRGGLELPGQSTWLPGSRQQQEQEQQLESSSVLVTLERLATGVAAAQPGAADPVAGQVVAADPSPSAAGSAVSTPRAVAQPVPQAAAAAAARAPADAAAPRSLQPAAVGTCVRRHALWRSLVAEAPELESLSVGELLETMRQGLVVRKSWVRKDLRRAGSERRLQVAVGPGGGVHALYPHGLLKQPRRFAIKRAIVLGPWRAGAYVLLDTSRGMLRLEPASGTAYGRWVLGVNAALLAAAAAAEGGGGAGLGDALGIGGRLEAAPWLPTRQAGAAAGAGQEEAVEEVEDASAVASAGRVAFAPDDEEEFEELGAAPPERERSPRCARASQDFETPARQREMDELRHVAEAIDEGSSAKAPPPHSARGHSAEEEEEERLLDEASGGAGLRGGGASQDFATPARQREMDELRRATAEEPEQIKERSRATVNYKETAPQVGSGTPAWMRTESRIVGSDEAERAARSGSGAKENSRDAGKPKAGKAKQVVAQRGRNAGVMVVPIEDHKQQHRKSGAPPKGRQPRGSKDEEEELAVGCSAEREVWGLQGVVQKPAAARKPGATDGEAGPSGKQAPAAGPSKRKAAAPAEGETEQEAPAAPAGRRPASAPTAQQQAPARAQQPAAKRHKSAGGASAAAPPPARPAPEAQQQQCAAPAPRPTPTAEPAASPAAGANPAAAAAPGAGASAEALVEHFSASFRALQAEYDRLQQQYEDLKGAKINEEVQQLLEQHNKYVADHGAKAAELAEHWRLEAERQEELGQEGGAAAAAARQLQAELLAAQQGLLDLEAAALDKDKRIAELERRNVFLERHARIPVLADKCVQTDDAGVAHTAAQAPSLQPSGVELLEARALAPEGAAGGSVYRHARRPAAAGEGGASAAVDGSYTLPPPTQLPAHRGAAAGAPPPPPPLPTGSDMQLTGSGQVVEGRVAHAAAGTAPRPGSGLTAESVLPAAAPAAHTAQRPAQAPAGASPGGPLSAGLVVRRSPLLAAAAAAAPRVEKQLLFPSASHSSALQPSPRLLLPQQQRPGANARLGAPARSPAAGAAPAPSSAGAATSGPLAPRDLALTALTGLVATPRKSGCYLFTEPNSGFAFEFGPAPPEAADSDEEEGEPQLAFRPVALGRAGGVLPPYLQIPITFAQSQQQRFVETLMDALRRVPRPRA
eukprot:scaffold9.g3243.t1